MPIVDPLAIAPILGGSVSGILTLLPGTTIQDNEYGLDVMVRPFFGMEAEIRDLAPRRGDPDLWLPNFTCTDRSFQSGKGMTCTAMITYKGIVGTDLPPPSVKGGWKETSTQLSTAQGMGPFASLGMLDVGMGKSGGNGSTSVTPTNGADGSQAAQSSLDNIIKAISAEVSVTYNSPTTTFLYVTKKEPKKPRYPNVLLASAGDFEILEILPASFHGRPVCNREVRTMSFEKEKVGRFWQVQEVNQGILTSLPVALQGAKALAFASDKKPRLINAR